VTRRLLVSFLTITLIVLAALEIPLALSFEHRELQDLTSQSERDAFVMASLAEDQLEAGGVQANLIEVARDYARRTDGRVVIVDRTGLAVVDTDPPSPGDRTFATRPEIEQALKGEVTTGRRRSETLDSEFVFVAVPVASGGTIRGAVRLTLPTSQLTTRVHRYWVTLGVIALVSLVAVMLAGFAFARWVGSPLERLQESAVAFGTGNLTARAAVREGPPEVRSLAATFNQMAERLEELISAQDAFVADASHQLRTPLTALRLQLENVRAGVDPDSVDAALEEVGRLSRLVDGLLALARAERRAPSVEAVDMPDVLRERQAMWQPLADERGVDIVVDAVPTVAECDRDRLSQVVDNLVANALDVSPSGSAVVLSCAGVDGTAELHVRDHGPGMTADERAHAFDRFWRAERETRADGALGGTGLGLAIVAKLVKVDGGSVTLDAAPEGGLDAVVRLPSYSARGSGASGSRP
jgi:signal transduction histidine kinase